MCLSSEKVSVCTTRYIYNHQPVLVMEHVFLYYLPQQATYLNTYR